MRVRIVSDGTPGGTQVQFGAPYRGGLGEERVHWTMVPGVVAVDWHLEAGRGEKAVAKVTLRGVEVEAEAESGTVETQSPQKLFDRTERPKPPDTGQD